MRWRSWASPSIDERGAPIAPVLSRKARDARAILEPTRA
jgi:hypothetical protein